MSAGAGGEGTPARVLVVCTANICRSPLAEALLGTYLTRTLGPGVVQVSSAGTHARPGDPVAPGMVEVATSWRLDLGPHRSRRIDLALADAQDLIVTMERAHRSSVSRLGPGVATRTFTLTELAAVVAQPRVEATPAGPPARGEVSEDWPTDVPSASHTGPHAVLTAAVTGWHRARVRAAVTTADVDDPYGGPRDGYVRTAWELAGLVEVVGPAIGEVLSRS